MQKNEVGLYLTPYTKVNSKWIKHLNIRAKTIKHLEEGLRQILQNTGFSKDFLDMTPKAQATQEKIDKLDFMKIFKFCAFKGHYQQSEKVTHKMEEHICRYLIRD